MGATMTMRARDTTPARGVAADGPSAATLVRWSGLGMMLAGLLVALFPMLHPNHDPAGFQSWTWAPIHLMTHVGALLAIFGLIGTFLRQFRPAGWLGLIGFVTATVATALILMYLLIEISIMPYLALQVPGGLEAVEGDVPPPGIAEASMLFAALFSTGYVLLGAAIVRAGVLPRAAGWLLAVGAPLLNPVSGILEGMLGSELPFRLSGMLFGLGLAWLGYALWQGEPRAAE